MGLFTALNARIVAAIERRSGSARLTRVAFANDRLMLSYSGGSRREVAWADLMRVVALRRDVYAGDEFTLLLEFRGPQVVEVAASCPGWTDLCTAIDALNGARRSGDWLVRLLSTPVGESIQVWPAER